MKIWVLTSEVNDYNQKGEYFKGVFSKMPTILDLKNKGIDEGTAEHLLKTGGGRRKSEDMWYYLCKHNA